MPTFKEAAEADIKGVFMDALEFADMHRIVLEGFDDDVLCVLDSDIIDERTSRGGASSEYAEGVYKDEKMLYVAKSDLPYVPIRFELLTLDSERYIVQKVSENMGVLEITIEANES